MISPDWDKDEGRAIRYRPSPAAMETLSGKLVRKARGKVPCAMVQFDGEGAPRPAYLERLEWADG